MTRTVRAALWDAEEVNAGGSRAYLREHLVDAKTSVKKPLYDRVSVYLNIDNGGGKIRGDSACKTETQPKSAAKNIFTATIVGQALRLPNRQRRPLPGCDELHCR